MPLIIEDDNTMKILGQKKARATKPLLKNLFGNKRLTGTGGRSGLFTQFITPATVDDSHQPYEHPYIPDSQKVTHDLTETEYVNIPAAFIPEDAHIASIGYAQYLAEDRQHTNPTPDQLAELPYLMRTTVGDLTTPDVICVNDIIDYDTDFRMWARVIPQTIHTKHVMTQAVGNTKGSTDSTVHMRYRIEFMVFNPDDVVSETVQVASVDDEGNDIQVDETVFAPADGIETLGTVAPEHHGGMITRPRHRHPASYGEKSWCVIDMTYDVADTLRDMADDALRWCESMYPGGVVVDRDGDEFRQWAEDYNLYQRLVDIGEKYQDGTFIEPVVDWLGQFTAHLRYAFKVYGVDDTPTTKSTSALAEMVQLVRSLEYRQAITLDAYKDLYTSILAMDDPDKIIAHELIKNNMQLKLNAHLNEIESAKSTVATFTPAADYAFDPALSVQQRAAVSTTEPFSLTVAGAGTGKTRVIMERVDYLAAAMEPLNLIRVLSFTNAAADNVTKRNPMVSSMTIAKMIHDNYVANWPEHQIAPVETLVNSIDIYFGDQVKTNDLLRVFRKLLQEVSIKQSNATMNRLSGFVEKYTEEVMEILDYLKQTCLELQIILSYIKIDEMVEVTAPPRHLIVDEVQDNSTMEFIYLLRYAAKHNSTLFLVGDSSQTLYEFRAANPKALNALEASGVFATYRLTTNYRSRQVVLDVANVMLRDIEANQYANIQLHANSMDPVTADEFQAAIGLVVKQVANQKEFSDNLSRYIKGSEISDWLMKNIENGEQTCFMAHSRKEVRTIKEALDEMFVGRGIEVADLTSQIAYASTTFSKFVKRHWKEVVVVPPVNVGPVINQLMIQNLAQLEPNTAKNTPMAQNITKQIIDRINDWWRGSLGAISDWNVLLQAGHITTEEFFNMVRDDLLNYEMRNNSLRQSLIAKRNEERKKDLAAAKPLVLVSTIHGVKGLEFDNTVIVQKPESASASSSGDSEENKRMFYVALTRARKSEIILTGSNRTYPRMAVTYKMVLEELEKADQARAEQEYIDMLAEQGFAIDAADAAKIKAEQEELEALLDADFDPEMIGVPSPIAFNADGEVIDNPRHRAWLDGSLQEFDEAETADDDSIERDRAASAEEEEARRMATEEAAKQKAEVRARQMAMLGLSAPSLGGSDEPGSLAVPSAFAAPGTPTVPQGLVPADGQPVAPVTPVPIPNPFAGNGTDGQDRAE